MQNKIEDIINLMLRLGLPNLDLCISREREALQDCSDGVLNLIKSHLLEECDDRKIGSGGTFKISKLGD